MTREELPPSTSASDVSGLRLEKVAASEASGTGLPFSSTNSLRRRVEELAPKTSDWMSLRRLRAADSEPPTKRALLLLGMSVCGALRARPGLELEA